MVIEVVGVLRLWRLPDNGLFLVKKEQCWSWSFDEFSGASGDDLGVSQEGPILALTVNQLQKRRTIRPGGQGSAGLPMRIHQTQRTRTSTVGTQEHTPFAVLPKETDGRGAIAFHASHHTALLALVVEP